VSGSSVFRTVALVLLLVVLAGVGVSLYNAGVSAGVSQQLQQVVQDGQTVTVAPYPYGPYWHGGFGFGFFGIIFWIFGILLIIGLIRAAFGWGRGGRGGHGGPGGWARGGYWYGRSGWSGGERVADWHRELHRREAAGETGPPDEKQTNSTI
jgi:hypothetical protein